MQSKRHSALESITNVSIGYGVAIASQIVIFPQFGINVATETNLIIGAWFTIISICRSYILRRIFNKFKPQRKDHNG